MCEMVSTSYITSKAPADVTTSINLIITAINLIVALAVNFFVFSPRRTNERQYQLQAALFKALVVDNTKNISEYSSKSIQICLDLAVTPGSSAIVIKRVEKACDEIELLNTEFSNSIIPIIFNYKQEMAAELAKAAEHFYDKCTEIVTAMIAEDKANRPTTEQILALKTGFLQSYAGIMHTYSPKP